MKNKMFKMSLILLFSIFSNVKSGYESGFDEFNQPVDSQGFIDQDKYMKNFTKIYDWKNKTVEDQGYDTYFKYRGTPEIKNNQFLNEELLHNFNKWGDWDLNERKENIKKYYNYGPLSMTWSGHILPWDEAIAKNVSGRSNYDRFKENIKYNKGNIYVNPITFIPNSGEPSTENWIPSHIHNYEDQDFLNI